MSRRLTLDEINKRGCKYCTDRLGKFYECKWEECPYHELDDEKYSEYLEKMETVDRSLY